MGEREVEAYLTYLATERAVSASTQSPALAAILFLYQKVLGVDLPWLDDVVRAKQPKRLPFVIDRQDVHRVLTPTRRNNGFIARVIYGTGARVMEALRLRIRDIDFDYRQIVIRSGKGHEDRVTVLPDSLIAELLVQLDKVRELHQSDLAAGYGAVYLSFALARRYPNASRESQWQYVFPQISYLAIHAT